MMADPINTINQANKEMDRAITLFSNLSINATEPQRREIMYHICTAAELWINTLLPDSEKYSKESLGKKIQILMNEGIIRDKVLISELTQINELRNIVVHANTRTITFEDVNYYLQLATHFIKLKEPNSFIIERSPLLKTLANNRVRSKSEVIIANILTYLNLDYEYEKPLNAKHDETSVRPDFTILFKGKEYYWEHLNDLTNLNYKSAWLKKQDWYRKNGYEDNLIISYESSDMSIDSQEILLIAKNKILKS